MFNYEKLFYASNKIIYLKFFGNVFLFLFPYLNIQFSFNVLNFEVILISF